MKKFVIAGTLVGSVALGGSALAQSSTPAAQQPAAGAMKQTAKPVTTAEQPAGQTPDQPAAKKKTTTKKSTADDAAGMHTAPKAQPNTTADATAPGPMALGTVHIPKGVKADGKDLPAGVYSVRLTADAAKPDAKGSDEQLERWVEFVKGGQVAGREVVSIVPTAEKQLVQKDTPPPANGAKVEALKGGDYVRVWINKGGNYYLVHLTKS